MARFRAGGFVGMMCGIAIVVAASPVLAQNEARPLVWDVARSVLIDPTTYAPSVLSYTALRVDWRTSQVFLDRGWLEQNPRFTISGRPNDLPVSYKVGKQIIRREALGWLQSSVTHNLVAAVSERVLTGRYPQHRRLFRTLGWIERVSFASYTSYLASAEHFRQANNNRRLARDYGYSP